MKMKVKNPGDYLTKVYGILLIAISWICTGLLMQIPSEGGPFFGFSISRIGLGSLILLFSIPGFLLFIGSHPVSVYIKKLGNFLSNNKNFTWTLFANSVLFMICWVGVVTPAEQMGAKLYFYERLIPLFLFFSMVALINLAFLTFFHVRNNPEGWKNFKTMFSRHVSGFLQILIIVLGFFLFAFITGLGFKNDGFYWNVPGIPLRLGEAIFLVFMSFWLMWWGKEKFHTPISKFKRIDVVLFFLLFMVTAMVWAITPMETSFFAPRTDLPNLDFYPFSDAAYYDTDAQLALIGQGMGNGNEVDKPLYSSFVFFTHILGGWENYQRIAGVHAMMLAVSAGLIYLLGTALYSRIAGVVTGISITLLGRNMILSATWAISANPKLLIPSYFSGIVLMVLALFLIRWNEHPGEMRWVIFIGATLGLSVYARHNFWFVIPFVLAAFLFVYWQKKQKILVPLVFLIIPFLITFLPWLIRDVSSGNLQPLEDRITYRVLSRFGFTPAPRLMSPVDQHSFESSLQSVKFRWRGYPSDLSYTLHVIKDRSIFQHITYEPEKICNFHNEICVVSIAGEWNTADYQWTVSSDNLHHRSRQSELFNFYVGNDPSSMLNPPLAFFGTSMVSVDLSKSSDEQPGSLWETVVVPVANHFMHNITTGMLSLPMQFQNRNLEGMIKGENSLWTEGVDLDLTLFQWFALLTNAVIFGIGVWSSFNRVSWSGLVPLFLLLAYDVGLAIPRTSGGRYLSAIQWGFWLYWMIGILTLCVAVLAFFNKGFQRGSRIDENTSPINGNRIFWRWHWFPGILILLCIGVFPVLIDKLIPQRYPAIPEADMVEQFIDSASNFQTFSVDQIIQLLAENPQMGIQQGRLLYPRFYWANVGGELESSPYAVRDDDRLVFTSVGSAGVSYGIFPVLDSQIPITPQASDVTFIGCVNSRGYFDIFALLVNAETEQWYYEVVDISHWRCND